MALLPVLLLVLMQAPWSLLGQRQGPVNLQTGPGRDEKVVVQNNTERGEWLGKTMIKKWSNNGGFEKKMGVSG